MLPESFTPISNSQPDPFERICTCSAGESLGRSSLNFHYFKMLLFARFEFRVFTSSFAIQVSVSLGCCLASKVLAANPN